MRLALDEGDARALPGSDPIHQRRGEGEDDDREAELAHVDRLDAERVLDVVDRDERDHRDEGELEARGKASIRLTAQIADGDDHINAVEDRAEEDDVMEGGWRRLRAREGISEGSGDALDIMNLEEMRRLEIHHGQNGPHELEREHEI